MTCRVRSRWRRLAPRGVGDSVAFWIVVLCDFFHLPHPKDCVGCDRRRDWLNWFFPWGKPLTWHMRRLLRLPTAIGIAESGPCRHLGDYLGLMKCKTCPDAKEVPVYACAVHKMCTLGKRKQGAAACRSCGDYVTLQNRPSPAAAHSPDRDISGEKI